MRPRRRPPRTSPPPPTRATRRRAEPAFCFTDAHEPGLSAGLVRVSGSGGAIAPGRSGPGGGLLAAALEDPATLALGAAAPDAVVDPVGQGVLEALVADGAAVADPAGSIDADPVAREEGRRRVVATVPLPHPHQFDLVHLGLLPAATSLPCPAHGTAPSSPIRCEGSVKARWRSGGNVVACRAWSRAVGQAVGTPGPPEPARTGAL